MGNYLSLAFVTFLTVIASMLFFWAERKTPFGKQKYAVKQVIFGLVFGFLSILGTELGVNIDGAVLNVRDVAPICAGLIFGAPAGIIAGILGGVERFFAVFWGAGEYTRVACTVATIFAGCFAGWCRIYMFGNKRPAWYYGLATGIIIEVVHMMTVFLSHMNDARNAFAVVEKCTMPMVFAVGIGVALTICAVHLLDTEARHRPKSQIHISQTFQRSLLICIVVAFFVTSAFTFLFQAGVAYAEADELLKLNIADVKDDVSDASDANLLALTEKVTADMEEQGTAGTAYLNALKDKYGISEINVINEKGIITATTYPDFLGFDMSSGEQSAEFLTLIEGEKKTYVQSYQPTSYDSSIYRKYAGVALDKGGFVQVGYDSVYFQQDIAAEVIGVTEHRHVGENGYMIICDEDRTIVSSGYHGDKKEMGKAGLSVTEKEIVPEKRFEATIYGERCFCMYEMTEGYFIIAVVPKAEALLARNMALYTTIFMEVIVFTALFVLIYFLIKRLIVNNLRKVNGSLSKITEGDLDETVNVRNSREFSRLSDDINTTVTTLKRYIAEAEARIDEELEYAKTIQSSSLPSVFPPYPGRSEFDIWAGMKTAKEVGGDFYDFYLLGEDKLAFLIADVSGKGIPAAMFMMTSKTQIKSFAETGIEVDEVFNNANEHLCENNEAGMFVTAWMGILNLRTGLVSFANAGHNPPLVRKKNGDFQYLRTRPGLVLAGMEGMRYRKNELQLEPGDVVFLYTDGVTEATNAENELYGEERLLTVLNCMNCDDPETICRGVKADVDAFVGDASQFDDITMVCVIYNEAMKEQLSARNVGFFGGRMRKI